MMSDATRELAAIEGDEIVIRVPISAIPEAASVAFDEQYGENHDVNVIDAPVFARELLSALLDESEDGTTLIHEMLDKACIRCAEDGAEGLSEEC